MLIRGITVTLYERTPNGKDPFGRELYTETPVDIDNVIVGQPTADEIVNELNLTGKHLRYILGIPKGDEHNWEDCRVTIMGEDFKTYGAVIKGIEELVPLYWHKQIKVETYE